MARTARLTSICRYHDGSWRMKPVSKYSARIGWTRLCTRPRQSVTFARPWHSFVLGLSLLAGAGSAAFAQPVADCGDKTQQGFAERFVNTYKEHLEWNGSDPNAAPATFRGAPVVVESPPFPFTNWPLGGSENIGYENMYYGALMDTIYCGPNGQAWKDSRFTIYGWLEGGGNIST